MIDLLSIGKVQNTNKMSSTPKVNKNRDTMPKAAILAVQKNNMCPRFFSSDMAPGNVQKELERGYIYLIFILFFSGVAIFVT